MQLYVLHHISFDTMYAVEVAVEGVLTSVLFATLRAYNVSVLAPEMHIFDVTFQTHLMEILVAVTTSFARIAVFFGRCRCSR